MKSPSYFSHGVGHLEADELIRNSWAVLCTGPVDSSLEMGKVSRVFSKGPQHLGLSHFGKWAYVVELTPRQKHLITVV